MVGEFKRNIFLFPLFNFMFWDSLVGLFRQKRKKAPGRDELFSRIQIDFFHTALEYPLDRRLKKIDVNLILDTRKKVTEWLEGEEATLEETEPYEPYQEPGLRPVDLQEPNVFHEEMEAFLLDLAYRKVITGQQLDLLLEVKVYCRMTTKEWAEARGVPHAIARSLLARAQETLRRT